MIKCELINIYTNKIIKAKSVTEFCKLAKLNQINDKIHLYPLLREERLERKGWCLPKYCNTYLELKDIYGNIYKGKIKDLVKKYKVPPTTLWKLLINKKKINRGLYLNESKVNYLPPKNYKVIKYTILSPNNKEISGKTITAISKQLNNSASRNSIQKMINGHREYCCNGYKLKNINIIKKEILKEI